MPGSFAAVTASRNGTEADAGRVPGRQLTVHRTASGQDFEQSGSAGLSFGQQGMPSGMDAISDAALIGADVIAIADDGTTAGAIKRLKIARIESRRGIGDQTFTRGASHIIYRQGSVDLFTSSLAPRPDHLLLLNQPGKGAPPRERACVELVPSEPPRTDATIRPN